ncbi:(Fe-S)-binding protein [Ahniella affigens]|nr:(Fe-S)-binding protein [Ahniella affigens]
MAPQANTQSNIALLSGCTGHALDRAAIAAVIEIATALRHSITILPPQCCGSLHRHAGDLETATALQSAMRNTLEAAGDTTIVHLNSGCDQQVRMIAGIAKRPALTVLQWLTAQSASLRFRQSAERVALHHPCTSSQSERQAVERLLRMVPGLDIRILDQHAGCCGAAGDQFLRDTERADAFVTRWLAGYASSNASIILSSNIGCSLQLSNQDTISATIMHPVVFLASLMEPSA